MNKEWRISDSALRLVRSGLNQYLSNPGPPAFDYCPAIVWSLGGDGVLAGGERIVLPPRYSLAIIDRADIPVQGFYSIEDPAVGIIAFNPSAGDKASSNRLIDYDGKDLVVR